MDDKPTLSATPPDETREASKSPTRWILRGVLLMFVLLVALLGYALYLMGPTGVTAQVQIPRGSGAAAVGRILEQAGLVRSGYLFAQYLRFSGQDKALKPGYYRLEGNGLRAIALAITGESRPLTVRITFPEGWRAVDMAQRLSENNLDGPRFLELVNNPPSELRPAEAKGPTLEGYLFPATYDFPLDFTAEDVIRTMTRRMEQEFTPEAQARLQQLGLQSIHDWVTLASIVQAEAANSGEKPVIAGVFLNRLEIGMPLQADPTVAYGLGKRLPELDRGAGDFEKDTPYNTYTRRGLPPGAISNPGTEALRAVLNPVRTNEKGQKYLYFLHAQGRLFLNVDFEGHLRDTAKYYR
ncbi:endolytic transglycosylase MltG [Meiothermus ruber]|jgi:UPF0755 protein|uniref:Endolytic murein transglycosylase n=1 Tax=Meiothermus ruber (strain ATCC 35948 / DSM 1279 / VKM B-1258 / 21) TaxID=504728 RepID=D3PPT0_MEIRD|nr:endolytic transglycosylase MltG [Meiothermus ruber]ADD29694.1 aminodeoxychorismate lyase [Meiothermus ruber DSM 1279]AGK04850.1 aminodeoxychorismate lyase [Meiothermus ruber DSM 1279]MCL6530550.1 endolytic transglycosylase MltG [Meiothermus ruber]GAO76614.1 aminodeoxychorismate lyase [Meiothermus ruber H328]